MTPRPAQDRCRVSEDELAHDRAENEKPLYTCTRCGEEYYGDDPAADNWLICADPKCDVALCEECCTNLADSHHTAADGVFCAPEKMRWFSFEQTHNAGFCSPGCMARALGEARRKLGLMRERLLQHCADAEADLNVAGMEQSTTFALNRLSVAVKLLACRVRAVCKTGLPKIVSAQSAEKEGEQNAT